MIYAALLCLLLAGCAIPSRTEPWCLPQGKYNKQAERVYVGLRCAW